MGGSGRCTISFPDPGVNLAACWGRHLLERQIHYTGASGWKPQPLTLHWSRKRSRRAAVGVLDEGVVHIVLCMVRSL